MTRLRLNSARSSDSPAVEPLEPRQLLSATLAGQFAGNVPAALLAGKATNHVTVEVSNTSGAKESGKVSVGLYVSATPDLRGNAVLVGTATRAVRLRPGHGANFPFRFASPATLAGGSDYLLAKIDGPGVVDGSAGESIVLAPHAVAVVQPFVDLTRQAIGPSSPIVEMGLWAGHGLMRVSVTNIGNAAARGPMQIAADVSLKSTFDAGALGIGSVSLPAVTIKAGATRTFLVPLAIPAGTPGGSYTLFANINPARRIAESDYANNIVTANEPMVIVSPTTTLAAGGGNGGYASDGSGFNNGAHSQPVTNVNVGGHTNIHTKPPDGAPVVGPPFWGGTPGGDTTGDDGSGSGGASCGGGEDSGGNDPGGGNSNCDNSGGDASGNGSSDADTGSGDTSGSDTSDGGAPGSEAPGTDDSGGDTSGANNGGNDSGADAPADGGGSTESPTDPGGDPNAGGDNGSDFGPDPGTDPGAGTDWGSDPGTDPGVDSGSDFSGGDSSGSDFGGDDGTDSGDAGGYADFATGAFKRSPVAKVPRSTASLPAAFRGIRQANA